jgi:hypothetical protein
MRRYLACFKYLLVHKWYVFWECLRLGAGFWRGLVHDWDKFKPSIFAGYARGFYTVSGQKMFPDKKAYAYAWGKHQMQPHHWQAWNTWDKKNKEIPREYLLEMIADWYGAGGQEWRSFDLVCQSSGRDSDGAHE